MVNPVIVVHGGAWYTPERQKAQYREGCRRAAQAGWDCLREGGAALDAVELAIRVLEDDPIYDAGRGSYFNRAGDIEMDAIIMDGKLLELGAVAAVQRVRNPITLARRVLELEEHNFIVGEGAQLLAQQWGIPLCDPAELLGRYEDPDDPDTWTPPGLLPSGGDTVGAVALDSAGNLAAGNSTGGTPNKRPGRVGDSPLVGAGVYADNYTGAAASTGWGERLMRIVSSKSACDYLAQGLSPQEAAEATIRLLAERVVGYGGIILVDRMGRIGLAHNTPNLSYAYVLADGEIVAGTER